MVKRLFYLDCDNLHHVPSRRDTFVSLQLARVMGWVISHDRKKCYCPDCAHKFKNVGRGGNLITRSSDK